MQCLVCAGCPKYKCTKCRGPYCSVSCYQNHQLLCKGKTSSQPQPAPVLPQQQIVKTDYLSDQELRLPASELAKLRADSQLVAMLKEESLRVRLLQIDNSKQRMTEVLQAMKQQQFYELYQRIMTVLFQGNPPE